MKKAFILLSHKLLDSQIRELEEKWHVKKIISLPEELQKIWSNVPPELGEINTLAKEFSNWIKNNSSQGDIVIVQGDYGLTCNIVNFVKSKKLIPVYATTKRIVKEEIINGVTEIKRIFEHVKFRQY